MFNLQGYEYSILKGTILTTELCLSSLVIAMLLGVITALAKLSGFRPLSMAATIYTTIVRSVPDLVLMLLIFFGGQTFINWLGSMLEYEEYIEIDPFVAGLITIGFIFGAYMGETFRGAILAVPEGQLEAGYSYGMSGFQVFSRILMPQMVRHAIPGFGNNGLVLMKSTAIVSIIGLNDMVRMATLASGATRMPFTFYSVVAINYLILTSISILILNWFNKKYCVGFTKD